MPSPFPGMDPFIESQRWSGFHATFTTTVAEVLTPQIRPSYVVDVEEYVYVMRDTTDSPIAMRPDVIVVESEDRWQKGGNPGAAIVAEPLVLTLPLPERIEQHYLVIRKRKRHQVITVIELLSPWNKAAEGRDDYLAKRNNILGSHSHLLELDLLRGGKRLPTVEPLPATDYFAFLTRAEKLPKVDVFAWGVKRPMPTVPVPLAGDDPDARLDLQAIFTTVYDRGGYDYALDYDLSELTPRLTSDDEAWAAGVLRSQKPAG